MPSSHQDSASQKDPHSPPEASTGACIPQGPTAHGQVLWSGAPALISSLQCWTLCLVGTTQSWEMPPPRRQKTDCSWQPQAQALVQGQQLVGSSLPAVPRIRPPAAACLEPEPGRAGKERRPRNCSAQLRPGQWLPCKVRLCSLQPLGPGPSWKTLHLLRDLDRQRPPNPGPSAPRLRLALDFLEPWARGQRGRSGGCESRPAAERTRPPHPPPNAVLLLQPKPSRRRAQGLPAAASRSGVAPRLQGSHAPPRQLGPTANFGSSSSAARAPTPHPAPAPPSAGPRPSPGSPGPSSPAAPPTTRGAGRLQGGASQDGPGHAAVGAVGAAPTTGPAGGEDALPVSGNGRTPPTPAASSPPRSLPGSRRTLSGAGATVNPSPPRAHPGTH
ncbi:putative uncharacterized protein C1orf229 [Chlorocebus sabaeus]|uniref:putative uncharacterized protein C1orf229 n=1 Tax=Chlorocebus sabaeus TaxID=60711 RepID=UPI003BFA1544